MKLQIYRVLINFIKKEISSRMFSCEFCEISHNIFFNVAFEWLLLHKGSFWLLFHHYVLPFQNRSPTYFPAEYFPGLISRLATRVTSISQILSQESEAYFQPSQTLQWSFFYKNSSQHKAVRYFRKKASFWMFDQVLNTPP